MIKLEWLDRSLFTCSHYYTLCTSEKYYKKALKHLNIAKADRPPFLSNWHSNATAHFFEHREDKKKSCIVCIGNVEGRTLVQVHAMLVHEAVHLWQETRNDYGEKEPSAELEAYAIQSISQRLMEEYERQINGTTTNP